MVECPVYITWIQYSKVSSIQYLVTKWYSSQYKFLVYSMVKFPVYIICIQYGIVSSIHYLTKYNLLCFSYSMRAPKTKSIQASIQASIAVRPSAWKGVGGDLAFFFLLLVLLWGSDHLCSQNTTLDNLLRMVQNQWFYSIPWQLIKDWIYLTKNCLHIWKPVFSLSYSLNYMRLQCILYFLIIDRPS